jgi:DICT domain-containing protein
VSSSVERAREYRRTAERLRRLAERAQYPEVQAELTWLAHSYERLAADPSTERIQDGLRSLEIAEERPSTPDSGRDHVRARSTSD